MLSEQDIRNKLVEHFGKSYYKSKKPSENTQTFGYDIIVTFDKEPTDAKD